MDEICKAQGHRYHRQGKIWSGTAVNAKCDLLFRDLSKIGNAPENTALNAAVGYKIGRRVSPDVFCKREHRRMLAGAIVVDRRRFVTGFHQAVCFGFIEW